MSEHWTDVDEWRQRWAAGPGKWVAYVDHLRAIYCCERGHATLEEAAAHAQEQQAKKEEVR